MSNVVPFLQDSFRNLLAGFGVPGRDKSTSQHWALNLLTPQQLEYAFRSDWIARKIVQLPAFDAARAWRTWQATQKQVKLIEAAEKHYGYQLKLNIALERARLYGGAAIIMGVDQGKFNQELDIDKVKKDDLKFVHVVSRWMLAAGPRVRDITSPWFGEPTYYERSNVATAPAPGNVDPVSESMMNYSPGDVLYIHPSRVVRLIGHEYPDMETAPDAWGDSVLQPVQDALKDAGLVSSSVATMIAEAKIDVIQIPGLRNIISTDEGSMELSKRFSNTNVAKSVINSLLIDSDEKWDRKQLTLSGYEGVMAMYLNLCSGAADIPSTRLVGREPAGQNSTGESDLRNYYDRLSSEQVVKYTPALARLDEVLLRSTLGSRDPDINYTWKPLWQLSGPERSAMMLQKAQSFKIDAESGLIDPEALARGRVAQLVEDDVYPGMTMENDNAIGDMELLAKERAAATMPLPPPDGGDGNGGGEPKPKSKPKSKDKRQI